MIVKCFDKNKNGKIEFTPDKLEQLLNEIYSSGYSDGQSNSNYWWWTSPYYTHTTPYYNYCTCSSDSCSSTISNSNVSNVTNTIELPTYNNENEYDKHSIKVKVNG